MQNGKLSAAALSVLGVLCLCSADSFGQATAPASTACAPAQSAPPQSRAEEIAALYQRFECHFARQEYAACLPYLEQACALTDSPRCSLNLGAVHHALMHCQRARGYYRQYLDRVPYDEDGEAARNALEELERACAEATARSADTAATAAAQPTAPVEPASIEILPPAPTGSVLAAPEPPDAAIELPKPLQHERPTAEHRPSHTLAWSLLGAGAASLTVTVVAATYGARAERDFEARYRNNGQLSRSDDLELRAIDERGQRYNRIALVFGVLSGVLAGAGTTLWLVELAPGAAVDVSAQGGATLRYSGRF